VKGDFTNVIENMLSSFSSG